jgi:DNA-binding response OmpR family regulator
MRRGGQKIAFVEASTGDARRPAGQPRRDAISIAPSCPILIIHDDDPFRRQLVKALDQRHFTVTMEEDGAGAIAAIGERSYPVILLGLSQGSGRGTEALRHIRDNRAAIEAKLIIVADGHPELRQYARDADEFLIRPVDPTYVANRARAYCP